MKRKSGRKSGSKKEEENSNGVEADNRSEQNGDTSEHEEDEAPKSKRKKAGKSGKKAAPAAKKAEAASGDSDKSEDEEEYAAEVEHKKKKAGKFGKKNASKKDEDTLESEKSDDEDSNEVEIKTPKGRKTKQDKEDPLAGLGETDIVEEVQKKKTLKKAAKKTPQKEEQEHSDQDEDDDNEQYEVEEIMDMKKVKGVVEYLIRWKGYGEESDTWEPADTLSCPELIKAYKEKHKGKPKKDKKKEVKVPDWDENEHFEVDRILEVHHKRDGSKEFLVHWKGYSANDSSWEPESNLDCKELIDKFMAKVQTAKNVDEKELRVNRKQVQRYTLATTETGRRLSRRFANKERVQYHDAE